MTHQQFRPVGPLTGELTVPGDKSISHRAALIGAMADGQSRVRAYLDSADTRSTLAAVAALGAALRGPEGSFDPADGGAIPGQIEITGVGLRGAREAVIDVGNAGTLIRLIAGWLSSQPGGNWTLDGDASIRRRPMGRVIDPLREMGAVIESEAGGLAPLRIQGTRLRGIEYASPLASAQVKSCLLLAGLGAEGETTVTEPSPSRDHTERMLAAAGAPIEAGERHVSVAGTEGLRPLDLTVPGDISSAAFFLVAGALVPGSEILLRGVGVNPTRTGVLEILQRMGAEIGLESEHESGGEPVADLRVRFNGPLRPTEIGGGEIPRAIDELPLLALAACYAEGRTVIRDAADLRRKESDRIATTTAAVRALGGEIEPTEDGFVIEGRGSLPGDAAGGTRLIDSHGDHRIAMLGAVAGLAVPGGVQVRNMEAAAVSYPTFMQDLGSLGPR